MRIKGTTISGEGHAHANYPRMIAAAAVHCPEVADCGQYGTINIRLDRGIDKGQADCWTPRTVWKPVHGLNFEDRVEEFGFTRIQFEYPLDRPLYEAWIIMPSGHLATYIDAFLIEIIAAALVGGSNMKPNKRCAIRIEDRLRTPRPQSFGDKLDSWD
jgi:hypothetical protein